MSSAPQSGSGASNVQTSVDDWHNHPPYAPLDPSKPFPATWSGTCHCKAVTFQVHGDPLDVKWCHCKTCQRLHAAPAQWAAIFHKKDVLFTKGGEGIEFYYGHEKAEDRGLPRKVLCEACHSAICDEGRNMIMLMPTLVRFPSFAVPEVWKPRCHIFYAQRVLDIKDGTPKWAGHKEESERLPEE